MTLIQMTVSFGQCEIIEPPVAFIHGVASGDATQHEVIIWTRITPLDSLETIGVNWMISKDDEMGEIVSFGQVVTSVERDFTVKMDVSNLQAGQWYYYQFESQGIKSAIGRTHTLPDSTDHFAFASFSCSNYEGGYFNAYRHAAERTDIQAVFHLGDYYYEYFGGAVVPGRNHIPFHTLYSLEDYRLRHAQVCTDPDAKELRRLFPWYVQWDDHEFANDSWPGGSGSHDTSICTWEERKAASKKAYFEWMPIRENADGTIHRHFDVGQLASLNIVDSRMEGRSVQVASSSPLVDDPTRTILGESQMQWLHDELLGSEPQWKFMFNSVMVTKAVTSLGYPLDADKWEGYRFERDSLLRFIAANGIQNFVSVVGDFHCSWAGNLPLANYNDELHEGSAGVELMTCATTSAPHTVGDIPIFLSNNPHVKWIEQQSNGYMICNIEPDKVRSQWIYIDTKTSRDFQTMYGKQARIDANDPFVQVVNDVLDLPENNLPKLKADIAMPTSHLSNPSPLITDVFPNPSTETLHVKWCAEIGETTWQIFDVAGKKITDGKLITAEAEQANLEVDTKKLSAGLYFLHLQQGNREEIRRMSVIH